MSSADTTADQSVEEVEEVEVDERRQAALDQLSTALGDGVVGSHIRPGDDLWVRVERDSWPETARAAKAMGYGFFDFLSAIDWLPSPFGRDMDAQEDLVLSGAAAKDPEAMGHGYAGGETRFQVIARLYSLTAGMGIHFRTDVPDDDLRVGTWRDVFAGADWHERETAEMFGIGFDGHPNLIKLYLPTDFLGYPLRKDFPLLARRVRPWPGIVDVEPMPGGAAADEGEGEGE